MEGIVLPAGVARASIQLWDQFDALNHKVAQGLLICRDFSDLLIRRATIDEEYATKLQAFAKEPMGMNFLGGALSSWFSSAPKEPPISKEANLLKIALERPQGVAQEQSAFLLEFVAKVRNEIVKPLNVFVTSKDGRRKELMPEAQKWMRTYTDAKDDVLLKRSNFQKTMQTVDQAAEALEKEDQRVVRDDKAYRAAEQKYEQANEKGKAAEKEYMESVNLANQIGRDVFQKHMPALLDELQAIEFERVGTLNGALNVLCSLQESYSPFLQEKFNDMSAIVRKHQSPEKDWNEWASTVASKGGNPEVETVVFEPYISRYVNSQTSWQRPPPLEPRRPIVKGVVSAVLGDSGDDALLSVTPSSAPAFEEEIIDPFNYRPPSLSEPPRYIPEPEPQQASFSSRTPPAGARATPLALTGRPVSPSRVVIGTSPPSSVVAAAAQRKPSPQRVPSTPPVASAPVAPHPTVQPAAAVIPVKITPLPVAVTKPVAKANPAAGTSILGAAIASQKPSAAVAGMRDRAQSDARPPPGMAPSAPRTPAPTVPVSPRGHLATITVAPRQPPASAVAAVPAPLSPRGGATVMATWERKGPARPASERKDL